jgi:hypothetical protein
MKKIKGLLIDLLKAVILGLAVSAAVGLLLFLGGFLFGGFQVKNGVEVGKDGLLLIASLGMFFLAGMLLSKGKKPEQLLELESWRKHFQVIGYKTMIGVLCLGFLAAASVFDDLL